MKRVNLRLDVTEDERDLIRKAAALGGFRSMAEFCRMVVLQEAETIERTRTVDKLLDLKRNDSQKDSHAPKATKKKR